MSGYEIEADNVDLPSGASAAGRRTWVKRDGRALFAFSQNAHRAYIFPLFTPSGVSLTTESPIDHPHHSSLTIGADHFECAYVFDSDRVEIGSYNFYVNETFQGRAPGRILAHGLRTEERGDQLRIEQRLEWRGPSEWGATEGRALAKETRVITVSTSVSSNTLRIRSRLEPTDWRATIGPTRHAYFTLRMADGLRVVDGGQLVDSEGLQGASAINGSHASWARLSGVGPHGRQVGVTLRTVPGHEGFTWHAYDWGSISLNAFRETRAALPIDFAVDVIAHDGEAPNAPG